METQEAVFKEATEQSGLGSRMGGGMRYWLADWDGDGYVDLIGLNHGLNSRFRASTDQPARLWVSAIFDENGSVEQILTTYNGQDSYPMVLRHNLVEQLPGLKRKYLKYASTTRSKQYKIYLKRMS